MTDSSDVVVEGTMTIERDVMVPTRDGSPIAVDVFRPTTPGRYPVIMSMSPYGKDVYWPDRFPLFDRVDDGRHMVWETENPDTWVPEGYVLVRADTRGTGRSPGLLQVLGRREQEDCYDVVEWSAVQPWSTGRVGMSGISWFAMLAWSVAALKPPHLSAVIPWDGLSDFYREWAYQGGIHHKNFTEYWWTHHVLCNQFGLGRLAPPELARHRIDLPQEIEAHPLADEWHAERTPALEDIEIPVLSASAWGSVHLHLRGNVEGFERVASEHKRLILFPGDHIAPFYSEWALAERRRFFDRWLKEEVNGAESDPPVRLALRDPAGVRWRDEPCWPLSGTRWTRWHLDGAAGILGRQPATAGTATWRSPDGQLDFLTPPADEQLEITGPAALRLWVSTDAPDVDVFVAVWQLDEGGRTVPAHGVLGQEVPHAWGCLRASHRTLDRARSLPHRPFHPHTELAPVPAGEPFVLDIEIWPTSIVLAPGHRLLVRLASVDAWSQPAVRHDDPADRPSRFTGTVTVHTGGDHDSSMLLPAIPDDAP